MTTLSSFKDFYRDMFKQQQVNKADMRAVFTEFLYKMNSRCPCAADPLCFDELLSQGDSWVNQTPPESFPGQGRRTIMPPMAGALDVCDSGSVARIHAQHSTPATLSGGSHFPFAYPAAA